ncbi:hypothetical protein CL628_00605 [bacterium]|nr:hypothetical protein [bacterium]
MPENESQRCVIDVGACVGKFTDDCLGRYPNIDQVFAFEPLPANFTFLQDKYAKDSRVEVLPQAVANFSGQARLFNKPNIRRFYGLPFGIRYNFAGNEGSSLKQRKSNVSKSRWVETEVVRLSDFIVEQDLKQVDILKIDCEGSEYDILLDLLDADLIGRVGQIYFEDHVRKVPGLTGDRDQFIERIQQLGVEDKFFVQDVDTHDDLQYIPLKQAYQRAFFRLSV